MGLQPILPLTYAPDVALCYGLLHFIYFFILRKAASSALLSCKIHKIYKKVCFLFFLVSQTATFPQPVLYVMV